MNDTPQLSERQKQQLMKHVRQAFDHDPNDYDGMGNYGRFPPEQTERPGDKKRSDLLLIMLALALPVIYYLLKQTVWHIDT